MNGTAVIATNESFHKYFKDHPDSKNDIDYLQVWLSKQKHLPKVTDEQLLTFLNSCNNSLEATKNCIDAYFTVKCASPELFKNRDPLSQELQDVFKVVEMCPLSSKSKEGHSYIFGRIIDPDVSKYSPEEATKLLFMVIDATLRYSVATPGIIVVYDMKCVQFQHIAKASPTAVKKYMLYVQEAMPVKMKAMHIINANPIINMIMMFIRPFMNKEHLQLLHFHTADQMSEFHKYVPQQVMPKDYGGQDGTVEDLFRKTQKQLESYREWFKEGEEHCKVDETKREGKVNHGGGDLLGVEGSFKKLDID